MKESVFARTWAEEWVRCVVRHPITIVPMTVLGGLTGNAVGSG